MLANKAKFPVFADGELKPTASYKRRTWSWFRLGSIRSEFPTADGKLEIEVWKSSKTASIVGYAVEEQHTQHPVGRLFMLEPVDVEIEHDGPYEVLIGHKSSDSRCTCTGFATRKGELNCKHVDAMAALLAVGPDERIPDESDSRSTEQDAAIDEWLEKMYPEGEELDRATDDCLAERAWEEAVYDQDFARIADLQAEAWE